MAASEHMKTLMKKKDDIESEIAELGDVLESQKGVGLDGPLIDGEGYPRADIDVYAVRHARHKIACLQTDHKLVMKEIEEELNHIHAEVRRKRESGGGGVPMDTGGESSSGTSLPSPPPLQAPTPFARIDRVDVGSPSADAGVEVGDEVVEFGSVSSANFASLHQIGEIVQHSIGRPVRVKAIRNGQAVTLSITPGPWQGRGNLGCNIVVIKR
ncbi:26S proteasome non-ATPase regulatory subunit 9-like [Babylonia areolata]|uniref:26S proteasome non-ATPase regulatory subunit 9-like n=1 Tax=Babylonia areolata TaxID=304850 RepID=UPI003FD14819